MRKFSGWTLLKEALGGQQGWTPQWRRAAPQPEYDAVIIGGGPNTPRGMHFSNNLLPAGTQGVGNVELKP